MAIKDWSTTAASNNSAPPDGFPENMAPSAVNDAARETMAQVRTWYESAEWINLGYTYAYVAATQFKIAGTDYTSVYHVGRRVRAVGSGTGTIYGTITASTFSTDTTVTVAFDSGSLSNETLQISYGVASATNTSIPGVTISGDDWTMQGNQTVTGTLEANGTVIHADGGNVASAANLALGTGNMFDVTGTTNVTSIDTVGVGAFATLQFDDALTLTHHATDLVLPGASNITTAAGDIAQFYEYAAGDWRCTSYTKASGEAVTGGAIGQIVTGTDNTAATTTTTMPTDDTIPVKTEGAEVVTVAITPTNASSTLIIEAMVMCTAQNSSALAAAIFVDTTTNAIAANATSPVSGGLAQLNVLHTLSAGSTSARTYKLRVGSASATAIGINGDAAGTGYFSTVGAFSYIKVTEVLP